MVRNSKQEWAPGNVVKVGFLALTVCEAIPTPGNYLPDQYVLFRSGVYYRFVPHHGLTRCISREEARQID